MTTPIQLQNAESLIQLGLSEDQVKCIYPTDNDPPNTLTSHLKGYKISVYTQCPYNYWASKSKKKLDLHLITKESLVVYKRPTILELVKDKPNMLYFTFTHNPWKIGYVPYPEFYYVVEVSNEVFNNFNDLH